MFDTTIHKYTLNELIEETLQFIRNNEPAEGFYVGFSGGKDSIVVLDLVRRSGVKHKAYFSMTFLDPPEIRRFIKKNYPDVNRLMPDMSFWEALKKKKYMPTRSKRYCCNILKHNTKAQNAIRLSHKIMGVRAEESLSRAARGRISRMGKWFIYRPVFDWSSCEIWEYIKSHNLQYPILYDQGWGRIGCVICPFLSKPQITRNRNKWPGFYRLLDQHMKEMWQEKQELLMKVGFDFETFMKWPHWPTAIERRQLKLFK